MKKIINKKLYDTDTAKELAVWDNDYYPNDFNYAVERLYRKRTGEYFLYGSGGGMSRYAEHTPSGWGWGQQIIPMTYDEAQTWAEEHLTADEYAEIFGMPDEGDDSKTVITITLPTTKAAALRQAAEKAGMSIGAYIDSVTN
jgi:hypothetical protein